MKLLLENIVMLTVSLLSALMLFIPAGSLCHLYYYHFKLKFASNRMHNNTVLLL